MKSSLLDYILRIRVPITIFVALAAFTVTYFVGRAERDGLGYSPTQPIAFSHKLHAGDMQIDCQYCHTSVEKTRFASVPSTETCMNCHRIARKDRPEIKKLTQFYEQNKPIPWVRIHRVPDFAYFSHVSHVAKGIDCTSCHGEVKNMEVVGQMSSFTMSACLDCHRNAHERLPNVKEINKGPDNCFACHR